MLVSESHPQIPPAQSLNLFAITPTIAMTVTVGMANRIGSGIDSIVETIFIALRTSSCVDEASSYGLFARTPGFRVMISSRSALVKPNSSPRIRWHSVIVSAVLKNGKIISGCFFAAAIAALSLG